MAMFGILPGEWDRFDSGGLDPTMAGMGLLSLGNMLGRRPRYSTNIADVTAPDNTGFQNALQMGLLSRQFARDREAQKTAELDRQYKQMQIQKAQREEAAQAGLQTTLGQYFTPSQSTMVNAQGLPTLPDAPDAVKSTVPGPANLPLDNPEILRAYAAVNPTGFVQELQAQRTAANKLQFAPQGSDVYQGINKIGTTGQKPPEGYTYGADGKLQFIPGGPADPKQAGVLAMARNPIVPVEVDNGDGTRSTNFYLRQSIANPDGTYTTKDIKVGSQPSPTTSINQGLRTAAKPEERALDAEAQKGLEAIRSAKFVNDDGTVNRSLVTSVWANAPIGEARSIRNAFDQAFSNQTYLKTGKAATIEELSAARARYLPNPLDDAKTVNSKLSGLSTFLDSYSNALNPSKGTKGDPLGIRR